MISLGRLWALRDGSNLVGLCQGWRDNGEGPGAVWGWVWWEEMGAEGLWVGRMVSAVALPAELGGTLLLRRLNR